MSFTDSRTDRRRLLAGLAGLGAQTTWAPLASLASLSASGTAQAQADARPLKLILPNATGSGIDAIARAAQGAWAKALGRTIVVDNQPGAGGIVGVSAVVRAAPDGATLGLVSNNVVIYPSVVKSLPFDPIADITPIAVIGATPVVLVCNPRLPAHNAKELVALLKAKPTQYNYGSSGNGTILHLATELILEEVGVKVNHVPYKGVGPMLTDLIGGQIDFVTTALPTVQAHIKSGALRALGVMSSQRVPVAADIPTLAEQGVANALAEGWFAVIGPKALPAAEVRRVHESLVTAFATPEVKEAMARQGNTIAIGSPEAAARFFRSELDKYARLVKKSGLEPQ